MSNRDQAFLKALTGLLNDLTSKADEEACFKVIEEDVDLDFVNGLSQWIASQSPDDKPFSVGKVMASLVYTLAYEIAQNSGDDKKVCLTAQIYSKYLHNIAHVIYEEDVEKKRH